MRSPTIAPESFGTAVSSKNGMLQGDEVAGALRRALANRADVRLALLFGSVARGTAHERSDVDVAVDASAQVDLAALAAELALAVGREVDVVRLSVAGIPLLEELLRDGVVLHEAAPYAAARWRSQVLSDLEIDRPWYGRMRDAWLRRVARRGLNDGST